MAVSTDGSTDVRRRAQVAEALRVGPPARRQTRVPWIVLGVLVVAGCALAAAVWAGRVSQRSPVLALARPVERGQVLAVEDLAPVSVAVDGQLSTVAQAEAAAVVGRPVAASLPAGTLLTEQMLGSGPGLAAQDRVVGLALDPGEYPTSALQPGDEVMVVRTPAAATGGEEPAGATVLVARTAVWAVQPLDEVSSGLLVSVLVNEQVAAPVAAAASQDRVRLVLAGSDR